MTAERRGHHAIITGGAGFIGSHLAERLSAHGARVTIIDNFSTGRRENLTSLAAAPRVSVIDGSVSDALKRSDFDDVDEMYHLAAAVGVRLILDRPVETIETNVLETSVALRFAAERNIPILIASSSEVYGKSSRIPFSEEDDVLYGPTSKTRWSYACTKAIDEYLALAYYREENLAAVVARFFNTVGPRQIGSYGMVLPCFVESALRNEPLRVFGDGRQMRCFCDVRDVVGVLPALLRSPGSYGRVFNVGRDTPIRIIDLARLVIETLGSRSEIVLVPYEEAYGPGFEDLEARQPNLSRLREATGFRPDISLEQTILDLAAERSRALERPIVNEEGAAPSGRPDDSFSEAGLVKSENRPAHRRRVS